MSVNGSDKDSRKGNEGSVRSSTVGGATINAADGVASTASAARVEQICREVITQAQGTPFHLVCRSTTLLRHPESISRASVNAAAGLHWAPGLQRRGRVLSGVWRFPAPLLCACHAPFRNVTSFPLGRKGEGGRQKRTKKKMTDGTKTSNFVFFAHTPSALEFAQTGEGRDRGRGRPRGRLPGAGCWSSRCT